MKYVEPDSVAYTYGWRGYIQRTVTHESNFVDPETATHTQGIERCWVEVKVWSRRTRGNETHLQSVLDFIAWKIRHHENRMSMDLFYQFS